MPSGLVEKQSSRPAITYRGPFCCPTHWTSRGDLTTFCRKWEKKNRVVFFPLLIIPVAYRLGGGNHVSVFFFCFFSFFLLLHSLFSFDYIPVSAGRKILFLCFSFFAVLILRGPTVKVSFYFSILSPSAGFPEARWQMFPDWGICYWTSGVRNVPSSVLCHWSYVHVWAISRR